MMEVKKREKQEKNTSMQKMKEKRWGKEQVKTGKVKIRSRISRKKRRKRSGRVYSLTFGVTGRRAGLTKAMA